MFRGDAFRVELDTFDQVVLVAEAHDRAVVQPGGDFQLCRKGGAVDDERMVAGRREILPRLPDG